MDRTMSPAELAQQIELKARKVAAAQMVSPFVVDAISVEGTTDLVGDRLAFMIRTFVYGLDGNSSLVKTHDEFTSWWQMFKQSAINAGNPFFRQDKVKRRPVHVKVTADQFSWWPDMDAPVPAKWGAPVRLIVAGRAEPMEDQP